MKIRFLNKHKENIVRSILALIPLFFAIWLFVNTSNSSPAETTEETNKKITQASKSEENSDEFESVDEFEEFAPYSLDEDEKADSSSATIDESASGCDGCSASSNTGNSVSCKTKNDSISATATSDDSGNGEILGFDNRQALIILLSFIGVILSGYAVRNTHTKKLRIFFILSGIIYFGFYLGGCPCPIIGVFKFFQLARGDISALPLAIWTAGILYLAYFLGKSWCGWICPIGGMQELVHRSDILNPAKSEKINRWLRILRIAVVSFLAVWTLFTGVILLVKIDPFKPIFNLFYGGLSIGMIVSLSLIVLTAPIIHRPFCKTICPLGFLMGLVSRIPGARRIEISNTCKCCLKCEKSCPSGAISIKDGKRKISYEDCNLCGDCLEACGHINIKGKKNVKCN